MKCSRVVLSLLVAIVGGALVTLGSADACPSAASDPCSMTPADICPHEELGVASDTGPGQAEEADYYDRGDEFFDGGEEFDQGEETAAVEGDSQDVPVQAKADYRYEYPEESYNDYGETDSEAQYAEQYYYKYGYQFANPEQKYGYADQYSEPADDNLTNDAMNQESADFEAGECYREAGIQQQEELSTQTAATPNDAEEALDMTPSEGTEEAPETAMDAQEETASADEEAAFDSGYEEYDLEGMMVEEEWANPEQSEQPAEEPVANTEPSEENMDAIASDQDAEMDPYEMEEFYPRYGYRFGRWKSPDTMATPEAANTADEPASPTPAAEAAPTQPEPQSGSVEERYGYAEYMGEDYLSELGETSQETAVSEDQDPAAAPESSETVDPEYSESMAPESSETVDPEYSDSMDPESSETVDPESSETIAPTELPASMDDEPSSSDYESEAESEQAEDSEKPSTAGPEKTDASSVDSYEYDYEYGFHHGEPAVTEETVQSEMDYGDEYGYEYGVSEDYNHDYADPYRQYEDYNYNYDYADPYRQYGNDYGREAMEQEQEELDSDQNLGSEESQSSVQAPQAEEGMESGIELFAYSPMELLTSSDQDLLRTLATLCEEPSGVRRAAMNDYLETQESEILDFATRFEDLTGIEVLGLADDLPGAAAFLASYRLLEQSELGMDEASDLLRRSLQRFTPNWIEGVNEMTANVHENTSEPVNMDDTQTEDSMGSADHQVVEALRTLACGSLREIRELAQGLPSHMSRIAWTALLPQFGEGWSVSDLRNAFDDLRR